MSRIFLHPEDPRFGDSIRLLVGQFCTVGSSSAADHCLRAAGIEAMHCRIGCRLNGGFLECINDESVVLVNGVPRTRARLTNGDRIKIGIVELTVDLPEKAEKRSFSVSFEDDDSPDGVGTIAAEASPKTENQNTEIEPEPASSAKFDDWIETEDETETKEFDFSEDHEADKVDTVEASDRESDLALTDHEPDTEISTPKDEITDTQSKPPERERKAVFEFDSVDAENTPFTDEDLAALENKGETVSSQNANFFSADLEFANVNQGAITSNEDATTSNVDADNDRSIEPFDAQSSIPGGSSQGGKFWKWIGDRVVSALALIEQREERPVCYFVNEHVELNQCSFEEVTEAVTSRKQNSIYLLSNNDPTEVTRFLVAKRWNERMRHPEALSMSISILPARHVNALFDQVDAVVLVQKSEVCLVRIDGGQ